MGSCPWVFDTKLCVLIVKVSLHGIYLHTQSLSLKSLPVPPGQV